MKKKSIFLILIFIWIISIILILSFMGLFSLTGADIFGIGWESAEGELSVGGGTAIPPTGDIIPETPAAGGEEVGGGGGSSGGAVTPAESFSIDQTFIVVRMKKGVPRQEIITITNNRNSNLPINISQENLTNIAFTPEINFVLNPKEEKEIIINLFAHESEERDVIIGKINFQSGSSVKSATLILNLQERAPLFDIKTTLLKKIFFGGQRAIANIKILNLGDLKNIDVNLESSILDSENNVYDLKKEMFAINDSFTGRVILKIPYDIPTGKYLFTSEVSYKNISADSYESFDVIEKIIDTGTAIFTTIILILITVVTLVIIVIRNRFTGMQTTEYISKIVPWGGDPNLIK